MKTTRTKITEDQQGYVTVAYIDPDTGDCTSTTYFVPRAGGPVRIYDRAGRYPLVCEKLCSYGSPLVATVENLPRVIRRELRRRRAAELAAFRRWNDTYN